jgi:hypothetical protein
MPEPQGQVSVHPERRRPQQDLKTPKYNDSAYFALFLSGHFFLFESPLSVPPETQILIFIVVRSRQQFSDNQALL